MIIIVEQRFNLLNLQAQDKMNIRFLTDAVKNLLPDNTPFNVNGATYAGIEILNDTELPSEDAVMAEYARVEQQHTDTEYQRQRGDEYPSMGDQLDYIYHHGIDAWKTDIVDPIKNKYPKP